MNIVSVDLYRNFILMEMENKSMLVDLCVVFGLVTEPVIPVKELSKYL